MDDRALEVRALCDGAVTLARAGNRIASLALLWSAVGIAPYDLLAHRRLAAALANSGDVDAAAEEYARFVELMLKGDDFHRAALEYAYARNLLGLHPALVKVGSALVPLAAAVDAVVQVPASAPARSPAIVTTARIEPVPHEVEGVADEGLVTRALEHAEAGVKSMRYRLPRRFAHVAVIVLGAVLAGITANNLIVLAASVR